MRYTRYWRDWSSDVFSFFSSRRRHTRYWRDWSSDVCSSDLDTQHAADDSLFSHAQADHLVLAGMGLEELHHDDVVMKIRGGGNDLVEVGREAPHGGQLLVQLFCGAKIVMGKDEPHPVVKLFQFIGFQRF